MYSIVSSDDFRPWPRQESRRDTLSLSLSNRIPRRDARNRALPDNEQGLRPPRVRRKRLLIFTIMQRARSGSIREKSPERKETRAAWPSRRDLTVPWYLFCRTPLVCKTPRKSAVDVAGLVSRELVSAAHFVLFGSPLSSDMHMHAVTINIFIARGMDRTRGIQRYRFAAPKTYNIYLYVRYMNA